MRKRKKKEERRKHHSSSKNQTRLRSVPVNAISRNDDANENPLPIILLFLFPSLVPVVELNYPKHFIRIWFLRVSRSITPSLIRGARGVSHGQKPHRPPVLEPPNLVYIYHWGDGSCSPTLYIKPPHPNMDTRTHTHAPRA